MRPKEFVARVIDLFEFDLSGAWNALRPTNFNAAAMAIRLGSTLNHEGFHERLVGGYRFTLESEGCLGHTVVKASMTGDGHVLGGSICFTFQDYDSILTDYDGPEHEHIFESWQVPRELKERSEEIVSMLTFLTLRSNCRIKHKTER